MGKTIEKRIIGEPGGQSGPFYSVVASSGRIVAMQIPDRSDAEQIERLPEIMQVCRELLARLDIADPGKVDSDLRKYARAVTGLSRRQDTR